MSEIRVRIAPSPTGDWHLGNARTALYSYLFARHHGGKFYLRIEDTDQARLVEGAVDRLLLILDWLGLHPDAWPDGQPYFVQSQNVPRYREIANQLVVEGKAYYCFATPEELENMRSEQQAAKKAPRYDNRWGYRDLPLEEAQARVATGESHVIRFKMPVEGDIIVQDMIRGDVKTQASLLDDFIVVKADGFPTYHLAHIVDDHDAEITHVLRGDEWLSSAPRHIEMYKALGWDPPQYAHLPVILGPDKGKLSKRHGAKPIFEYRDDGYLPEAVLNFLALLGWSSGTDQELFTPEQLIEAFDLSRVHPSPAVFDADRLLWFNGMHIRNLSVDELSTRLVDFNPSLAEWCDADLAKFSRVVASLHDRLTTLKEFSELALFAYQDSLEYDLELFTAKGQTKEDCVVAVDLALSLLPSLEDWSHDSLEVTLRSAAEAQGVKAGAVFWPLRVALTALPASPGVFEVLHVLGKEESLKRLQAARQFIGQ